MNLKNCCVALCLVMLAACAQKTDRPDAVGAEAKAHPFVTRLPDAEAIDEQYKDVSHDLSPLTQYHFQLLVPKDWQILDIALEEEPAPGDFSELGVFRQEGEWMENDDVPPLAEISVSLINPSGQEQSAAAWLDELLSNNKEAHTKLEERKTGSGREEAADYLFRYKDQGVDYVMRVSAFRMADRIIFLSCSDTTNGYRDHAEACYAALATLRFKANPNANPFQSS